MSFQDRLENGSITRRGALKALPATVAGLLAMSAVPWDDGGNGSWSGGSAVTGLLRNLMTVPAQAADAPVFDQWHEYSGSRNYANHLTQTFEAYIHKNSDSSYTFYFRTLLYYYGRPYAGWSSWKTIYHNRVSTGIGAGSSSSYILQFPGSVTYGPGTHSFSVVESGARDVDATLHLTVYIPYPSYHIDFNGNGGTLTATEAGLNDMRADVQINSSAYNLLAITPSRTNYTFLGFYDSPSGGTQVYTNQVGSNNRLRCANNDAYWHNSTWCHYGNVVAYAQWSYNPLIDVNVRMDGTDCVSGIDPVRFNMDLNGGRNSTGAKDWCSRVGYNTAYAVTPTESIYVVSGTHRKVLVSTTGPASGRATNDVTVWLNYKTQYLVRCEDWWVDAAGNRRVKLRDAGSMWYDTGATVRGSDWGTSYDNNTYIGCTTEASRDGLVVYRHWKAWVDLNLYTPNGIESHVDGNRVWVTLRNSNGTFTRIANEPGNPGASYWYGERAHVSAAGSSERLWILRSHSANVVADGADCGDANAAYQSMSWHIDVTSLASIEFRWHACRDVYYHVDEADDSHIALHELAWVGDRYYLNQSVFGRTLPTGSPVVRPGCTPGFAGFYEDRARGLGDAVPTGATFSSKVIYERLDLWGANRCTQTFVPAGDSVDVPRTDVRTYPDDGAPRVTPALTANHPPIVGVVDRAKPLDSWNDVIKTNDANSRQWVARDPDDGNRWRTLFLDGWKLDVTPWPENDFTGTPSTPMDRDHTVTSHWRFVETDGVDSVR